MTCGSLTGNRCRMSVALVVHGEGVWRTEDGNSIAWSSGPPSPGYCIRCGARVFFDAAGKPVAQAMGPADEADKLRGALDRVAGDYVRYREHGHLEPGSTRLETREYASMMQERAGGLIAAALAAAEEGAETDGDAT